MKAVRIGYYDRIVTITTVTNLLTVYDHHPAVFTQDPVPENAQMPYVVIRESMTDIPGIGDTKTTRGRAVLNDIAIYADDNGDPSVVEDIAEAIRDALHRNPITVSGYGGLIASVAGPVVAPTEEHIYGRVITAGLELIRT